MSTTLFNGRIVTPETVYTGGLTFEGERIARVFSGDDFPRTGDLVDCGGGYICPGFVDIHVHGAFGASFLSGDMSALNRATHFHALHGTTSILPTTASAAPETVLGAVKNIARAMRSAGDGARVLGAHLEGCYLNPLCAGAQDPRFLFSARPDSYMPLIETGAVRRVSASPEVEGALEMAKRLSSQRILMSVAHSAADYSTMMLALEAGFTHITHIYNALSMLSSCYYYPKVGACETALLHDEFTVEAICDGRHVPPQLLRLMYKIKGADRFHAVTDADLAGAPDGAHERDGMHYIVENDVCMLADRTAFAGSVATCDRLLRTLVFEAQIPLSDAVKMLTLTPARTIGEGDIGRLAEGMRADVNVLDQGLRIQNTYIGGKLCA
jgi:N-acetylglucosamine-6-phosphate deacetylase